MDVLPRPANEKWQFAAGVDSSNGFRSGLLKYGQAAGLVRVDHVDQVVGDAVALLLGRLGCADVHASIEEARIRRDDFTVQLFSKPDGNLGLTDRRRANNYDQWGVGGWLRR
jgi:hypothetical protein